MQTYNETESSELTTKGLQQYAVKWEKKIKRILCTMGAWKTYERKYTKFAIYLEWGQQNRTLGQI